MGASWNSPECCNVAGALSAQARERPGAVALHYPTGLRRGRVRYARCSYRELDELSDVYARGLGRCGIGRGARAALMVPPGREFFALFFALFKAGVVPVLIDPGMGLQRLGRCLAEAAPEAFIGVSRAQVARVLLRWAADSVRTGVTLGPRLGWGGVSLGQLTRSGQQGTGPVLADTRPDEPAAILFTSGSTGVPKGVLYRHRHFAAQVEMLREAFRIEPGEVDLATFPPFALFDPALGMTTVVPWMDPTRPARANPELLAQAIEEFGVTNLFDSPALLGVLGRHAEDHGLRFPTLRRAISAGAAVPLKTVRRMQAALGGGAEMHTPYGATECLPVTTISSAELDDEIARRSRAGEGVCVGRPVTPNRVAIMQLSDGACERLDDTQLLPPRATGEIVVHGPTTTDAYWGREDQTRLAKSIDAEGRVWHRMGDVGHFDNEGRLWFQGRKSQRVRTAEGDLFPDQAEAVFNGLPGVARTALVGVGPAGSQRPVLCVELAGPGGRRERIRTDLLAAAAAIPSLASIRTVLFHPGFPVDIRHNSKIGREALAEWATRKLA